MGLRQCRRVAPTGVTWWWRVAGVNKPDTDNVIVAGSLKQQAVGD